MIITRSTQELLKYIPTENTEAYESIIKAQKKIEGVVDFVNDRKRKAETLQRMSEIEHNIEGLKIVSAVPRYW